MGDTPRGRIISLFDGAIKHDLVRDRAGFKMKLMSAIQERSKLAVRRRPKGDLISRREFFSAGVAGFLAAGLWPGRHEAQSSAEDFQFLAVNDTHFRDEKDIQYFENLVEQIRSTEQAADFVLHAGDVVDGGLLTQMAPMKSLLDSLAKPYYLTPGNHDVDSHDESLRTYQSVFGKRAVNVWFEHKGWQFLGVDSTEGTKWKHVRIQGANLAWLQETLSKLDRRKSLVLFTHMPLGDGVPMRARNADRMLSMFVEHNLKGVFNGHFHGYSIRQYRGAEVSTDRCLSRWRANMDGSPEKGYFRCYVSAGQVSREFVPIKPQPRAGNNGSHANS